jgi:hypothetical protein
VNQNTSYPGQRCISDDDYNTIVQAHLVELWGKVARGPLFEIWFDHGTLQNSWVNDTLEALQPTANGFNGQDVTRNVVRWVGTESGEPVCPSGLWSTDISGSGCGDPYAPAFAPAGADTTLQDGDHWFYVPGDPVRDLATLIDVYHATVGQTTIVPAAASRLIERSLQPKDGLVRVCASVNDVMIESDRCVIFARLVEGRYPNWRQVFPKTERDSVQVDIPAGVLGSAIRRAAICTDAESRGIECALTKGSLQLSAQAAEVGSSNIETPVSYDGHDVNATLDYRYISDFTKVVDSEDLITIDIESSSQPVVLSVGEDYRYVIMPMARDR